jgi:hypothetical protein
MILFLFTASLVNAQEVHKSEAQPANSNTKVMDHNLSGTASPELNQPANNQTIQEPKPESNNSANSKKGYDYYKAKSDLNAAGIQNNPSKTNTTNGGNSLQGADKKDGSGTENKAFNQNSARSNNPQPKK